MATCRNCSNYDDCNKEGKIKIEVTLGEPITKLCGYVDQICRRFDPA